MRYLAIVLACVLSLPCFGADEPRKFSSGGSVSQDDNAQSIAGWTDQALKSRAAANRATAAFALSNIAGNESASDEERAELSTAASKVLKISQEEDVIVACIEAAARLKNPELVSDVARHISPDQGKLKPTFEAIRSLQRIGDPKAIAPLLAICKNAKAGNGVKSAACDALGAIGDLDTVKTLDGMHTKEKDNGLKEAMARAMDAIEKRQKAKN